MKGLQQCLSAISLLEAFTNVSATWGPVRPSEKKKIEFQSFLKQHRIVETKIRIRSYHNSLELKAQDLRAKAARRVEPDII